MAKKQKRKQRSKTKVTPKGRRSSNKGKHSKVKKLIRLAKSKRRRKRR